MKMIPLSELASTLKCSNRSISRMVEAGKIHPVSKNPVLFDREEIVEYLNKHSLGDSSPITELKDEFVTTKELSQNIGVKTFVITNWARNFEKNGFPHYRMSGTWFIFRIEEINNWFKNQREIIKRNKEKRIMRMKKAREYYLQIKGLKNDLRKLKKQKIIITEHENEQTENKQKDIA